MPIYQYKELIGNNNTISLVQRAVSNGSLRNACIFSGLTGTGKSTTAIVTALLLTCEHPVKGEPCLECKTCVNNIAALEANRDSLSIKRVNAAHLVNKSDISELITQIFTLQNTNSTYVCIIDEFQCFAELKDSAQVMFYDELERVQSNVYVLITTTHLHKLTTELISRCTVFKYGRLNKKESQLLLDRVCKDRNLVIKSQSIMDIILSASAGVPRNIIESVDFATKNNLTEQELKEFLGVISDKTFIELFTSMKDVNILGTREMLSNLVDGKQNSLFVESLKNFMVKLMFLLEGNVDEDLTHSNKQEIVEIFKDIDVFKLIKCIESLSYKSSENDIVLAILNMRKIIQSRSVSSIISEKEKIALIDKSVCTENYRDMKDVKVAQNNNNLSSKNGLLDMAFFKELGGKSDGS